MDKSFIAYSKVTNIASIFQAAQLEESLHTHLISKLAHTFNQFDVESFTASYITCLKKILVNNEDSQTCCASVALEFAVKFLIFLIDEVSPEKQPLYDNTILFWNKIFDFLKEKHNIADARIRKRICQFVARFMLRLSPDAELDCRICEIIIEIMKERIKDRSPLVRVQAILAVYRLQDSSNSNCSVTKMLLNCLETDTAADVRKLALLKISLKHKPSVRVLIDRVDDISEKVRKDVYLVFSKLHPLYFTSDERIRLLYTGFYNNSENVRNVVKNKLLPAWFNRMEDDYMQFLRIFDLIFDSPILVTKIVMSLIETLDEEKNEETINSYLDETGAIPIEKLTCENAFYWRCYVFYRSGLVTENGDYEWRPGKSYDAHAVGLLPDLSVFCEYMNEFYKSMSKGDTGDEKWKRREQEFIFIQLIELCKVYDYADEVGRKNLQVLCLNLLQEIQIKMLRPVIQLYFNLRTSLNESICAVTNEVNNLLHPPGPQELTNEGRNEKNTNATSEQRAKASLTPRQETSLKFKMAKLEVRLEELNDLQEEAIQVQDFSKANSLKNDITSVKEQISLVKESFFCKPTSMCYDSMEDEQQVAVEDEEVRSDNLLENIEFDTVLRCTTILSEMLNLSVIKSLTSELRALLQDFVMVVYKNNNRVIAPLATELLGSFCLRDKNLAKENFIVIFSMCGNFDIRVSALKVIFDFLACFGAETFNITNLDNVEEKKVVATPKSSTSSLSSEDESEEDKDSISGSTFISTLIKLLDDEYVEARYTVVHGLCRLMCIGKLKSAKILSRLIIIWFHPASKDEVEIRSCLNFFFPFFVKCKWSLPIFEDAIIPTMEILFEAPAQNPISEIDQKVVIKVLCDLTNPNYVGEENQHCDNIHHNLAVLICKSVIEMDSLYNNAILVKALEYLNLCNIPQSTLSTINNLMQKIIRKFKRKKCSKLAVDTEKFRVKLMTLVEESEVHV